MQSNPTSSFVRHCHKGIPSVSDELTRFSGLIRIGILSNLRRFVLQISPSEKRTNPSLVRKMNQLRQTLQAIGDTDRTYAGYRGTSHHCEGAHE